MEKSNKLYIMVGIPGSGKSTWIANHKASFFKSYKIVSRDEIRFSLVTEDEEYFSKEQEVFSTFVNYIKEGLREGFDVYADATHLNQSSRSKLLRALGEDLKGIKVEAIVINVLVETAIRQNANRTGRSFVPASAIKRMASSFTIPSIEEGFDKIWIYDNEKNTTNRYTVYEREV